jgi:hypothetical protein
MERSTPAAGGRSERAFILRIWREGEASGTVWRCSVEDPRTLQRRGFSSLGELLHFLELLTRDFETASLFDNSGKPERETKSRVPGP